MKKGILILVTMLLMVPTAEAISSEKSNSRKGYTSIYNAEPIQFMERGIKFYVFLDGDFDFNTKHGNYNNIYFKNKKRRRTSRHQFKRGVRIERDYRGKIRRIGNVFINYNRYGKVSRIGSIFVDYRHRNVSRVGGLDVVYNRRGGVRYFGKVKWRQGRYNQYHNWDQWEYSYDDVFFLDQNFNNDFESYKEDENYMYYRSKGVAKGKKGRIIKRKKD